MSFLQVGAKAHSGGFLAHCGTGIDKAVMRAAGGSSREAQGVQQPSWGRSAPLLRGLAPAAALVVILPRLQRLLEGSPEPALQR
jgi:hypothetical protein